MSLVKWREWNEDSFAAARDQDKPILLDIGAVWCHWCHVMDDGIPGDPVHTGTYSHPDIVSIIDKRFIPIKVDNDRRPDINARYNQGGWPTTVFLTPSGDVLYGETYIEPRRMLGLLDTVADYYRDHKSDIAAALAGSTPKAGDSESSSPINRNSTGVSVPVDAPKFITSALQSNFDAVYGGFGSQPKFPHPEALLFAIEEWKRTGNPKLKEIVSLTLDKMAGGGMYDKYAGGFFRYSTTRDWSIPHFEKMLQDNAKLSAVCFLAGREFGEDRFTQVGLDVHNWLFSVMRAGDTGCFAGSQDADKEEYYYGLPLAERACLPTPFIDRTVYVDWNALLISSLVLRGKLGCDKDDTPIRTAISAYRFLVDQVYPRHYWADGCQGTEFGMLTDLTALIDAAIDLHEATGEPYYLDDANRFADEILAGLCDSVNGGFYDIPHDPKALGALAEPRVEISGSSDAAMALLRLSAITSDHRYHDAALRAIGRFFGSYRGYSFTAASYARAVARTLFEPIRVVIVGDSKSSDVVAMRQAAWSIYVTGVVVETRSSETAGEYPALSSDDAAAYVCVGKTCLPPVSSASELIHTLQTC